jgi:hypothetical protein
MSGGDLQKLIEQTLNVSPAVIDRAVALNKS